MEDIWWAEPGATTGHNSVNSVVTIVTRFSSRRRPVLPIGDGYAGWQCLAPSRNSDGWRKGRTSAGNVSVDGVGHIHSLVLWYVKMPEARADRSWLQRYLRYLLGQGIWA